MICELYHNMHELAFVHSSRQEMKTTALAIIEDVEEECWIEGLGIYWCSRMQPFPSPYRSKTTSGGLEDHTHKVRFTEK